MEYDKKADAEKKEEYPFRNPFAEDDESRRWPWMGKFMPYAKGDDERASDR